MVMRGVAENDGYNALVMAAGLRLARRRADPHHLAVPAPDPRAVFAGLHVGDAAQACRRSPPRSSSCFTPASIRAAQGEQSDDDRGKREAAIVAEIETALGKVDSLDEDRIVRRFVNAVQSAIRTNYYQLDKDGQPKQEISIKFSSRKLDGVPLPVPLYEIFVYSPRVEAVHMRFGKVARGGIRWSDRPQDFRTEILGLVKAQQVKNAVIVPVGSKGGFVPKRMPVGGTREAIAGRGHRDLQAVHVRRCSTSPTISTSRAWCRPTTWCATTTTIRISWSPPTRAPRPSPTSPTAFRRSTTSGSATPSPPAARPATTTRAWASPRAAPGNR